MYGNLPLAGVYVDWIRIGRAFLALMDTERRLKLTFGQLTLTLAKLTLTVGWLTSTSTDLTVTYNLDVL